MKIIQKTIAAYSKTIEQLEKYAPEKNEQAQAVVDNLKARREKLHQMIEKSKMDRIKPPAIVDERPISKALKQRLAKKFIVPMMGVNKPSFKPSSVIPNPAKEIK